MNLDTLYSELTLKTDAKLVLLVLDGVGDIATGGPDSSTPLEAASTPNLDALTQNAAQGRMIPVAPGITPGSGPGHLGLFGYDPLEFQVGRGVIEALGLGLELKAGDIAARANFCTLNLDNSLEDRTFLRSVLYYQITRDFIPAPKANYVRLVINGESWGIYVNAQQFNKDFVKDFLTDADHHREGLPIPPVRPVNDRSAKAKKAAKLVQAFFKMALPVLSKSKPANGFLLRGIAHQPAIPGFEERYRLRPACIAVYPMYKGLAQLVGMKKIEGPQTIAEQFQRYLDEYHRYNYFFIHYKYSDMHGEDGDFEAKKKSIEELDSALPILLQKAPDVLAITGDHSTPCALKGHSWHPVPVLLTSAYSGSDKLDRFTETGANMGSLGVFESKFLIRLMQANARMFDKFGA